MTNRCAEFKACKHCKSQFFRKITDSPARWNQRIFCSRRCCNDANIITRTPSGFIEKVTPEPNSGCWLWLGNYNRDGYGMMCVAGKTVSAHRISWQLFKGESAGPLLVCHRCDNPSCVNPDHLFLGTASDNQQDSIRKGRFIIRRGDAHLMAKLSSNDVLAIREDGRPFAVIAKEYSVSKSNISCIKNGRTWVHL